MNRDPCLHGARSNNLDWPANLQLPQPGPRQDRDLLEVHDEGSDDDHSYHDDDNQNHNDDDDEGAVVAGKLVQHLSKLRVVPGLF